MNRIIRSLVLGVPLVLLPGLIAMNNADVIKMQQAGLSEDTIVAAIQKEKPEYDTSVDALIALKQAGVSEKVIQALVKLQSPAAAAAPAVAAPAPAAPGSGPFWGEFPSIAPGRVTVEVGRDYFTRYAMREEKNEHSTTNYTRGSLIPINTPVKLVAMSGNKLTLKRLDNGQEIKVENEPRFTKKTIAEIAHLMLSAEKTPLERLPEEVAAAIRAGEMRKGMTKELVLMARGYPPAHETPSLEGDRWIYWTSRFVKHTVLFHNGRLSEGRGLF